MISYFDKTGEVVATATVEEHEVDIKDELGSFTQFDDEDRKSEEQKRKAKKKRKKKPIAKMAQPFRKNHHWRKKRMLQRWQEA